MSLIKVLLRKKDLVLERVAELGLRDVSDVKVIAEVTDVFDVLLNVRQQDVDVVATTDSADDRGMACHLLAEFPDVTLLVFGENKQVYIEQRCVHRFALPGNDEKRFLTALRNAVEQPCDVDQFVEH